MYVNESKKTLILIPCNLDFNLEINIKYENEQVREKLVNNFQFKISCTFAATNTVL